MNWSQTQGLKGSVCTKSFTPIYYVNGAHAILFSHIRANENE